MRAVRQRAPGEAPRPYGPVPARRTRVILSGEDPGPVWKCFCGRSTRRPSRRWPLRPNRSIFATVAPGGKGVAVLEAEGNAVQFFELPSLKPLHRLACLFWMSRARAPCSTTKIALSPDGRKIGATATPLRSRRLLSTWAPAGSLRIGTRSSARLSRSRRIGSRATSEWPSTIKTRDSWATGTRC